MPKALKIVVLIVLLIILLVAGLLSFILFGIDPNDYKPQVESAARNQGIELQVQGDLGWSLFPKLALNVGSVQLSSETYQILPSTLESVRLDLAWLPLFKKQVVIDALTVAGADIHLKNAEQAAAVAAAPVATADVTSDQSSQAFSLAVHKLELSDSKFSIHNADQTTTVVDDINMSSQDLNSTGDTFPIKLSFQYALTDKPAQIALDGDLSYTGETQLLNIPELRIEISNVLEETIKADINAMVDTTKDEAELHQLTVSAGGINLGLKLKISQLTAEPHFSGQVHIDSDSLKSDLSKLLGSPVVTGNPDALKTLDMNSAFNGTAERVTAENLTLKLDNTTIKGKGDFQFSDKPYLQLTLTGDQIDLDDYMAPAEESEATANPDSIEGEEALLAPVAGIVVLMNGGKGTIDLKFDGITVAKTALVKPEAVIKVNGNKLSLDPVRFGLYDGQVNTSVDLNFGAPSPSMNFKLALAGIDIAQAQEQWTENTQLRGNLTMETQGSTRGNTTEELMNQLSARGNLSMENLHLAAVNVEQSYCEVVRLVEKEPPRDAPWPEGTDLDKLTSQFTMEGQTLQLQNYATGVGNLKVRGKGKIELDRERFDIDVIANLQGDRTSENGCIVKSKRIQNRDLPLRCKDSFAKAGATSCRPDSDFVKGMLQNELMDKLIKPSDDGEEKPVESLLKGIFGR